MKKDVLKKWLFALAAAALVGSVVSCSSGSDDDDDSSSGGNYYMSLKSADSNPSRSGTITTTQTYTFTAQALDYDSKADMTSKCGEFTWSFSSESAAVTLTPSSDTRSCTMTVDPSKLTGTTTSTAAVVGSIVVQDTKTAKGNYFNDGDYSDVSENFYRKDSKDFQLIKGLADVRN